MAAKMALGLFEQILWRFVRKNHPKDFLIKIIPKTNFRLATSPLGIKKGP
jgi:hypothetical protein